MRPGGILTQTFWAPSPIATEKAGCCSPFPGGRRTRVTVRDRLPTNIVDQGCYAFWVPTRKISCISLSLTATAIKEGNQEEEEVCFAGNTFQSCAGHLLAFAFSPFRLRWQTAVQWPAPKYHMCPGTCTDHECLFSAFLKETRHLQGYWISQQSLYMWTWQVEGHRTKHNDKKGVLMQCPYNVMKENFCSCQLALQRS